MGGHLSSGHFIERPLAFRAILQPQTEQAVFFRLGHRSQILSRSRYCDSFTVRMPSATKVAMAWVRLQAFLANVGEFLFFLDIVKPNV